MKLKIKNGFGVYSVLSAALEVKNLTKHRSCFRRKVKEIIDDPKGSWKLLRRMEALADFALQLGTVEMDIHVEEKVAQREETP